MNGCEYGWRETPHDPGEPRVRARKLLASGRLHYTIPRGRMLTEAGWRELRRLLAGAWSRLTRRQRAYFRDEAIVGPCWGALHVPKDEIDDLAGQVLDLLNANLESENRPL